MKTMEERAASAYLIIEKEVQEKLKDLKGKDRDYIAFALGFTAGVVLQRCEDTKKACEWWESRCDNLGISRYQIELFKKAMEE